MSVVCEDSSFDPNFVRLNWREPCVQDAVPENLDLFFQSIGLYGPDAAHEGEVGRAQGMSVGSSLGRIVKSLTV